jgi:nitric oxide reductase large subunit
LRLSNIRLASGSGSGRLGPLDPAKLLPGGLAQLDAVYEHGVAYARSQEFYYTTLLRQWMRFPGDARVSSSA